ncbi:MAG TPA: cytochrome-c oxidase, cbb3-type subunit III [Sphingomonadaceae bacterium]|nr:cytochrome-c oxidase, cbb3-type subunit III [Sphingomonadaceae bacterium]
MAENKHIDEATGTETVGHEWDGIEELDTPMPRWWVLTFYATILWAIGYVIAYPALPLIEQGTEGVLGWTSRGALAEELERQSAGRAETVSALSITPVEKIAGNDELMQRAIAGGSAAFKVNCVQCHGSGAAGSPGYPNLNDDDWLWGGNISEIEYTLLHGIRHPGDDETRFSLMPAFGRDGILTAAQIDDVADHVLSLSGNGPANAAGATLFETNCAICHGPDGTGLREFGAPNLADAISLYGNDKATVVEMISNPRNGVMPAWGDRLDPVTIKMLAAYVHSLGGGEDFIEEVAETPAVEGDEQP